MWLRARLDIGWRDLLSACASVAWPIRHSRANSDALSTWGRPDCLITLSVRSAFDLALRALELPVGSEVLMSALTVPDMVRIVEAHGLVPVPVDLDDRWRICRDSLRQAITPRSRVLVVAHLWGDLDPLDDVVEITHANQLLLVEDCAQSFAQVGEAGHSESDFVLHSFGPIKTATALGGAVVRVRADESRARMADLLSVDPIQSRASFLARVFKCVLLKALSTRSIARLLWRVLTVVGVDMDRLLNSLARGFRQEGLLAQLRRQPSTPLLLLMSHRWRTYDFRTIARRRELGRRLDAARGPSMENSNSYWVYPVLADEPASLCNQLRQAGFDATTRSRMSIVPSSDTARRATRAVEMWSKVLFLPWYPELSDSAVEEMAAIIAAANGLRRGSQSNATNSTESTDRVQPNGG